MRPVNQVPIKITAVVKRDSKLSQQQVAVIAGALAIYAVFAIYIMNLTSGSEDTRLVTGAWCVFAIVTFMTIRIIMRWGLNEKRMYANYIADKTNDIKKYWGIIDIAEDGKILYTNGHMAYVIKMERSNVIGRSSDFEEQHFASVTTAIRQFMTAGFLIKKYSLATNDDNSESFSYLDKNRLTLSNKKLKSIVGDIIKYSKSLSTGTCNRYVEYWLVYAKEPKKDLRGDVLKIFNDMKQTIYKPEILSSGSVYKFINDFYKLRYINYSSCFYHNIPNEQVLQVVKDSIRYRQEAKGTFEPMDVSTDVAVQKWTDRLRVLDNDSNN